MKETTYNKYKRERNELMQLVDIDIRSFVIGQKDVANRVSFLKRMMLLYRTEQEKKLNKEKEK